MKRKNVHLSERQLERLTKLAKNTDIKMSEHIRRAIDEYLEKDTNDLAPDTSRTH